MTATPPSYTVAGTLRASRRTALGGLFVEIVDRGVGQDVRLGGAVTDAAGRFTAELRPPDAPPPDLLARLWTHDGPDATLLGASDTHYNAGHHVILDIPVSASSAALPSEYEALNATIRPSFSGRLGDLEESAERDDVTYLANKTGWDARAVAMAGLADRLSRARGDRIQPPFYYALLRAGLPADDASLHRTAGAVVEAVWQQAVGDGVIPADLAATVSEARTAYEEIAVDNALQAQPDLGISTLEDTLDLTLTGDGDSQRAFVALLHRTGQDPTTFWKDVEATFDRSTRESLQLDGDLALLTFNNVPMIRALKAAEAKDAGGGPLVRPLDLALRGYAEPERWSALVADTVPDAAAGITEAESTAYAEVLARRVRDSFPTAAVAARIQTGGLLSAADPAVRDDAHRFLSDHAVTFDIANEPIGRFLVRNPEAQPVDPRTTSEIERVQRVWQLTAENRERDALLDQGFDAAAKIVRYPEERFVTAMNDVLGEARARKIHARSRTISSAVLAVASRYLTARVAPPLGRVPDLPIVDESALLAGDADGVIAYPDLETLFGSVDYCSCMQCRSVLSPAAYLVDLLQFIDIEELDPNPLDVLNRRRPDVQHVPLTCENTNGIVPEIDLINETLEFFVGHGLSLDGFRGFDTGAAADDAETLAAPQHLDDQVSEQLKAAKFPAPLPFCGELETMRRLLEPVGVALVDAMTALRPDDSAESWRNILIEHTGLSRPDHALLVDEPAEVLFGLGDVTTLSAVRSLSARLGSSYEELAELLGTAFVNPDRRLVLADPSTGPAPSFEDLVVRKAAGDPLDAVDYVRMMRFVRLRRTLGWSIALTDAAIGAFAPEPGSGWLTSPDTLNRGCASMLDRLGICMAAARRLRLETEADLRGFIACWAPPGQTTLSGVLREQLGGLNTDDQDALRAGLRVTSADFELLVSRVVPPADVRTMYGYAWLARALGLSVSLVLTLTRRLGIAPFAPSPTAPDVPLWRLLDIVDAMRVADLAPAAAMALVFADDAPSHDDAADALVSELDGEFAAIDAELSVQDPDDARFRTVAALAWGTDVADHLLGMVSGALSVEVGHEQPSGTLPDPVVEASGGRLGYDREHGRLSHIGRVTSDAHTAAAAVAEGELKLALEALFRASETKALADAGFADSAAAITRLLDQQPELKALLVAYAKSADPPAKKRAALLGAVAPRLVAARRHAAVLAAASRAAGVPQSLAATLLDDAEVLGAAERPDQPAIADFLTPGGGDAGPANRRATWARFVRAASLADALRLSPGELAFLARRTRWLSDLLIDPDDTAPRSLGDGLISLVRFSRIKAELAPDDDRLLSALQAPAESRVQRLCAVAGWDVSAAEDLLTHLGIDLDDPEGLVRLQAAFAIAETTATSTAALRTTIGNDPSPAAVRTMEQALRARTDAGAWRSVRQAISDPLRRLRRDALVAFILGEFARDADRRHIDTPDKLFEFFLMDVQMEPCMQTSRIRHALSATQLFIERVVMNLDTEVASSALDSARWEWMRRYRLWEANRQVFLWPENWLEPELREDQSPFYRQSMNELLQSDITDETAAAALLGYLSKLEEVAKLEPCSLHYVGGSEEPGDEIAHVVARTAGAQRKYFHRRRAYGSWSPWEPVDLDIDDNPVVPVFWKGRLLVFWLKLMQRQEDQQPDDADQVTLGEVPLSRVWPTSANQPKVRPQAVLCWSEYYNGKWQPAKTSNVSRPTELRAAFDAFGASAFDRASLVLRETMEGDALRVRLVYRRLSTSFRLHNTHSLPLREEDANEKPLIDETGELLREVSVDDGTLTLRYTNNTTGATAARMILKARRSARFKTAEPFPWAYSGSAQQSFNRNVWTAPFLLEDSRHVFYVTTELPGAFTLLEPNPYTRLWPTRRTWAIPASGSDGLLASPANLSFDGVAVAPAGRTIALETVDTSPFADG